MGPPGAAMEWTRSNGRFRSLAAGQNHAVAPGAFAAAVANYTERQDADRESIRQALRRPNVREIAAKTGIDITRVSAAGETLSGSDLELSHQTGVRGCRCRSTDGNRHIARSALGHGRAMLLQLG